MGTYGQGCCGCGGSGGNVVGCRCAAWCWSSCDAWVFMGRGGVMVVVVVVEGCMVLVRAGQTQKFLRLRVPDAKAF